MAAKLSLLQLFFALTWVVYVIYLPALAEQAGIEKRFVPWILMMDQAIFIACDWAAGVYADRVAGAMKRIGEPMALATGLSCAAFVALPFVAPALGAAVFLALTAMWSATSSALRAPPMALISRHVPESQHRWLSGAYLLGLGIAGALGPYLALALKGVDPRVPFVAASIAVVVFTLLLVQAERGSAPAAIQPRRDAGERPSFAAACAFSFAVLLAALGFQLHFSVNSAPGWLRVAPAERLPWLMPVFWIGFNLAVLPATLLAKRWGGMPVFAAGATAGFVALLLCARAPDAQALVWAQLLAGAAWGVALTAAFTAALELGRPGHEGLVTGLLFSVLAAAALARLASVAAGLPAWTDFASAPAYAWGAVAVIAAALAARGISGKGSGRGAR